MALPSWATETVTRIRPTIRTQRGSEIPDWSRVITAEICGCSIQPAGTMLSQDGRVQGIQDGLTCYLPPEADVKAGSITKETRTRSTANHSHGKVRQGS